MFNDKVDKGIPYINDINVAVIMDSFSYNSFKLEFNAFVLEPDNWENIFEDNQIDLLFCESVWYGVGKSNVINGTAVEYYDYPWQNKISYSSRDKDQTLYKIIQYCKDNEIPTVFWNKEDPVSFDKFIDSALLFDYIFTTDEGSIIKYNLMGHSNVHQLLFASQVKYFNPICYHKRSKDIIFAGSWYGNSFLDRQLTMIDIFNKIIDSDYTLKIYDRNSDIEDIKPFWKFPEEYQQYVNPKVTFDKLNIVYKESKYSLNINSITDSLTMFSRRIFELMSSYTFIISNYSEGLYDLFGDNVLYLDKMESLIIDEEKIDEICEENLYEVLENHTCYERFKLILDVINFDYYEKRIRLVIFYSDDDYERCIDDFNKIKYNDKKCIIISEKNFDNAIKKDENIEIISFNDLIKRDNSLSVDDFFMFRNLDSSLNYTFIKKAFLHYKYLEDDFGIKEDNEKYIISKTSDNENILFNGKNFEKVFNNIFGKNNVELKIYSI